MSRIGDFADDDVTGLGGEITRHRRGNGEFHQRGLHQEPTADAGA